MLAIHPGHLGGFYILNTIRGKNKNCPITLIKTGSFVVGTAFKVVEETLAVCGYSGLL